ncbi:MAG TPA: class I SAM-dependent methyltransferase [Candidatus Acidoferrales bacterium]|nr:class I SAM-dependent methyltransferase [Candidatus Acidoferrales bacterium]
MSAGFQPRFGYSANEYATFRPDYPVELFERILAVVPPHRRERAIDLGAGTGHSTRPLLPHFTEVIVAEPDALMAEKLRSIDARVDVRIVSAEDLVQEPDTCDLVTIAAALYWMDTPRVIANVGRWLRRGGILAMWAGGLPRSPEAVTAITLQEFADRWSRFRDPRLDLAATSQHARSAVSIFSILEDCVVPNVVWITPREFAGFWRSTSYGSAYARELAVPEAYWRDLEVRYSYAWPKGKIPVDFGPWLLLARKD